MARLDCSVVILVYVLFCFLGGSGALEKSAGSGISGIPQVRNLSVYGAEDYALPGLAHKTAAGAVHHGMKEGTISFDLTVSNKMVGSFLLLLNEAVFAPGYGTIYVSDGCDPDIPGEPQGFPIYPNATVTVPVWNTNEEEDLQVYIIISRPPMKLFSYEDWSTPHNKAVLDDLSWNTLKSSSELEQSKESEVEDEL